MAKETSDPSDPSRAFADLSEWRKIAVAGAGPGSRQRVEPVAALVRAGRAFLVRMRRHQRRVYFNLYYPYSVNDSREVSPARK